jgi:hypothetical protein
MENLTLAKFIVTLLLGWLFFGWFGDFNMYVVPPNGGAWIKQYATLKDRVIFGFLIAFVFATLDTFVLWLWRRFRSRRERLPSTVGQVAVSRDEHIKSTSPP